EFNATYNFFDGLSPDDIVAAQSPLAGWAKSSDAKRAVHDPMMRFNDPLGALRGRYGEARPKRSANGEMLSDRDLAALKTLGLASAATRTELSRAYKALVRRYHPDSNGGDRSTERQLQDVVQAYTHLKSTRAFARPPKEP
ncbi:MAG: DnaJ domain-containing protein, partial [Polymorphobacter sp.]